MAALGGPLSAAIEPPASLRERQERIREVATETAPAVVALVPDSRGGGDPENRRLGSGSGVIVSRDGLILTAAHVAEAVGDEFAVVLSDGRRVKAKALGKSLNRDAALAQITTEGEYPFVDQAEPEDVKEGQWVLAMGHPGGYEVFRPAPLRLGRVVDADDAGFIVSDCTLSGGDSGGPLFNLEGKLIGIHSSIGWRLAENRHVPIGAFREDWERLMKGDTWGRLSLARGGDFEPRRGRGLPPDPSQALDPEQPVLGVTINRLASEGAVVEAVADNSPAKKAGLQAGDIIEKVNDEQIDSGLDLVRAIRKFKAGDEVTLAVARDGQKLELKTELTRVKDLR